MLLTETAIFLLASSAAAPGTHALCRADSTAVMISAYGSLVGVAAKLRPLESTELSCSFSCLLLRFLTHLSLVSSSFDVLLDLQLWSLSARLSVRSLSLTYFLMWPCFVFSCCCNCACSMKWHIRSASLHGYFVNKHSRSCFS